MVFQFELRQYKLLFSSLELILESLNVKSPYGTTDKLEEWVPQAGWYVVLSSIPVALVLLVVVFINKFPLPIDSEASSGEAL